MHATRSGNDQRLRIAALLAVAAVGLLAIASLPPIAQDPDYHQFADQRAFLGVANFLNVVSNLPLLLVGGLGLIELHRRQPSGVLPPLRPAWLAFFIGIAGVGIGSAYYHLAPGDTTLSWDRLPMTISFMALFCIVVGEQIGPRWGAWLCPPLLLLGGISVIYWRYTQNLGHGDLRAYIAVQFLPLLLLPLLLWLFPPRMASVRQLWMILFAYAAAKLFELADLPIFELGHVLSGHTLKHLAAGFASYLCLLAMEREQAIVCGAIEATITGR